MKLTERSCTGILLREKLKNSDILPYDNGKSMSESNPKSLSQKLNDFWTRFNEIKAEKEKEKGKLNCLIFTY